MVTSVSNLPDLLVTSVLLFPIFYHLLDDLLRESLFLKFSRLTILVRLLPSIEILFSFLSLVPHTTPNLRTTRTSRSKHGPISPFFFGRQERVQRKTYSIPSKYLSYPLTIYRPQEDPETLRRVPLDPCLPWQVGDSWY